MITDRIERLSLYESVIPEAGRIAAAFEADDPVAAGVEVRPKTYETKADDRRRFEVHFRTIDLMMGRSGREVIHICPMDETEPAEPLPGGADGQKRNGGPHGSAVMLEPGWFVAILPGEAHMVGGRVNGNSETLIKWVVKVPARQDFCTEETE